MEKSYFLTIDVGTKNLAICVCEYNKNNIPNSNILEKINIIDWEIIDVSYKPLYCKQTKNKRAVCNCVGKYYSLKPNTTDHSNPDNLIGYCKSHCKNIRDFNRQKNNKNNQIKLYSVCSNPIYKNNFSTQMEKLLKGLEKFFNSKIYNSWDYIDSQFKSINNLNIYIENQPVLKNPIMKSISVGIYTFFCIKKITHPQVISSINFINASVKTKIDFVIQLNNLIGVKSQIKDFKEYTSRKNFSEDIVGQIIPKLKYSREYFNNIISTSYYTLAKKKDDLADTLLYQIYIIIYGLYSH
jgi:hypothetical protein